MRHVHCDVHFFIWHMSFLLSSKNCTMGNHNDSIRVTTFNPYFFKAWNLHLGSKGMDIYIWDQKLGNPKNLFVLVLNPGCLLKPLSLLFIYSSIIVGKTCRFWVPPSICKLKIRTAQDSNIHPTKQHTFPTFFGISDTPTLPSLLHLQPSGVSWNFCSQHVSKHYNPWNKQLALKMGHWETILSFWPNSGTFAVSFRRFQGGGSRFG